ncbi:hypothetical protein OEV98_12485 [Caldibacillus lycopersici]|uniref:Uncharacterized protein n=1 Tax=Perspicuibacillus lycopersici TaxID=1325689 RepID=A0AAE3IWU1_9BACI|nr:hypothetical protein [Perspicuibacillus lycopersici]MCU9614354.1 hypothetical protein [Perspicuibacillus lycopersici]
MEFFNQFGFQHTYPDSVNVSGSRANYTRDVILDLNGSTKLDQVIQTAIHPRNYLGTQVNVTDVVESLNEYLNYDGYEIIRDGAIYSIKYKNENQGRIIKNLIFAADGPKPEIVLVDTLQYEIDVVSNSEYVLIFDGTISGDGLSWNQMVNWWSTKYEVTSNKHVLFYQRLYRSLGSNAERLFFQTYYEFFNHNLFADVPILIPQVYLHYDPYTLS